MTTLTQKQNETYEFIKEFIETNKYPPTLKEIADNFDVTLGSAQDRVKAIEKKGFIKRIPAISRGIIITE